MWWRIASSTCSLASDAKDATEGEEGETGGDVVGPSLVDEEYVVFGMPFVLLIVSRLRGLMVRSFDVLATLEVEKPEIPREDEEA